MSVLHIWGRMSSINVKKVVWAAQELGLDFQRTEAGGVHGVVKTPAYMLLNANSLVPMIEDDGFVLWESNTIVRYLCAKHAMGKMYPIDLHQRFDAERWMDWQQTALNPASRPGFWQLIRMTEAQRDLKAIADSNAAVENLMAMLDAHLAQRSFMVGEQFSMADIPVACEAHRWFGLPQIREKRPHVERWFASLAARPASKGVLDMALS